MADSSPTTRRIPVKFTSIHTDSPRDGRHIRIPMSRSQPPSTPPKRAKPNASAAAPPSSAPSRVPFPLSPNNSPRNVSKEVSETANPQSNNVNNEPGAVDTKPILTVSPGPENATDSSGTIDEGPHEPQEATAETEEQNPGLQPRAPSPTPSLPELHELLASTQTGRKPQASNAEAPTPPRGRKRRHSSNQDASPPKRHEGARRRHRDFWALDGSVVIQLENIIFRLHRSDLIRRSKYFAGLLAKPGEENDTVDGCPVYHVPGKAKDFERLWRAVDDAISYVHTPPPFPVFASILRAATDLEFPAFRAWAVQTFEAMWSLDLASVTAARKPHAAESIVLARKCDVPNVLRHAFYELSRHPSFGLAVDSDDEGEGEDSALLSRDDLTRLIQLRTRLQTDWVSVLQMAPSPCADERNCRISDSWASDLVKGTVFEESLFDPLMSLGKLEVGGLCKLCRKKARGGWERRKEKIWKNNLDIWLGLV